MYYSSFIPRVRSCFIVSDHIVFIHSTVVKRFFLFPNKHVLKCIFVVVKPKNLNKSVLTAQHPPSAVNIALPVFAAERGLQAYQKSTDI